MPGAGAGDRSTSAIRPVPLRPRSLSGQRHESGPAAIPKGPPTQPHRSARSPVSRPHRREPGAAGGGDVALRGGCSPGAFRERSARGDACCLARGSCFCWAGWTSASAGWRRQPSCRRIRATCISSLRGCCSRRAMRSGPPPKARRRSVLSEGIVTDAAIRYLLIRAYQKLGMPDRAAIHAEIMRTQESPALTPKCP